MNVRSSTERPLPLTLVLAAVVVACGGTDTEGANRSSQVADVVACELITEAEAEAILGPAQSERAAHESADGSACTLVGTKGGAMIRVMLRYPGGESTSVAWAAELQAERQRQAEDETDPDLKNMLATVAVTPLDGLGVPAAVEDVKAPFGQVALHSLKGGRGGTYLTVYADDLETARAITDRVLSRIP